MPKLRTVSLDHSQRLLLEKTLRRRSAPVCTVTRTLLQAVQSEDGPGWTDMLIADALDVGLSTVERTRRQAAAERIEVALLDDLTAARAPVRAWNEATSR
jgi:hypothetical protein